MWTPQALAAAISVLTIATCAAAIRMAQTYAAVVNIVEGLHRQGVSIRGAKGAGGGAVHYPVVARSSTVPAGQLLPLDPVAQLAGVTVSPSPAPTGRVDCGPACVVSEIEERHGCWSSDELLRLRYFGVVDSRLTTSADLVGMLQANHIAAHAVSSPAANLRGELVRAAAQGWSCLVLGNFISSTMLHWVKFRGDDGSAEVMDPWVGTARSISWTLFLAQYAGEYVHVDGTIPV